MQQHIYGIQVLIRFLDDTQGTLFFDIARSIFIITLHIDFSHRNLHSQRRQVALNSR